MLRRTINLKVELYLDQAKFLADNGYLILSFFEAAIQSARNVVRSIEIEDSKDDRVQKRRDHRARMLSDGRYYHREFRKRLKALSPNLLSKGKAKARREILDNLSSEFGIEFVLLDYTIKLHRRGLRTKIRNRRQQRVLKYYLSDLPPKEIAKKAGTSVVTVNRDLRDLRAEADSLQCSLHDLELTKTTQAILEKALSQDDETIIHWEKIKSSRGRP